MSKTQKSRSVSPLTRLKLPASTKGDTNPSQRKEPLWRGPLESGITFSLLSRFLVCRHRFWIQTVQGLREDEGFNIPLEFGSMFHAALEAHEGNQPWEPSIQKYFHYLLNEFPASEKTITKWYKICKMLFPIYVKHYRQHHETVHGKPVMQEQQFRIPVKLPSGRTVTLRGKFDSVFRVQSHIYLQENKTKGQIDIEGIQKTVDQNLQTMIYQIALREALKNGNHKAFDTGTGTVVSCPGVKGRLHIAGNIYNVVRRPLSEKYAIREKKNEGEDAFIKRLGKFIEDKQKSNQESQRYFYRWKVPIQQSAVDHFATHCLYPLLEQVCDWWESIKADPMNPWFTSFWVCPRHGEQESHLPNNDTPHCLACRNPCERGSHVNTHHWRTPFGLYNSMYSGFRGDYFQYLSTGSRAGLKEIDNLFPELEEHV